MFFNVLVNAGKLVDRVTEIATRSYFLFWFEIELNKSFKGIDWPRKSTSHPILDNNNENIGKAGVAGYNGDITQYLEEKGYTWEQLGEDSLKFWYDNDEHQ